MVSSWAGDIFSMRFISCIQKDKDGQNALLSACQVTLTQNTNHHAIVEYFESICLGPPQYAGIEQTFSISQSHGISCSYRFTFSTLSTYKQSLCWTRSFPALCRLGWCFSKVFQAHFILKLLQKSVILRHQKLSLMIIPTTNIFWVPTIFQILF